MQPAPELAEQSAAHRVGRGVGDWHLAAVCFWSVNDGGPEEVDRVWQCGKCNGTGVVGFAVVPA